jgi:bifunctional DNA-binding transcriptional regulator/antitoxin component of YhaV-PrlF toxin-antitoxin module
MPDPTQKQPRSGPKKPERAPGPVKLVHRASGILYEDMTGSQIEAFNKSLTPGSEVQKIQKKIDEGKEVSGEERILLRWHMIGWKLKNDPLYRDIIEREMMDDREMLFMGPPGWQQRAVEERLAKLDRDIIEKRIAEKETKEEEITVDLIHGNARTQYSIEIRIPKKVVDGLGLSAGDFLYYRIEGENRLIFEPNQSETTLGKVTMTERETGKGGSVFVIVIPSDARKITRIEKNTPLNLKVSRNRDYFVVETVPPEYMDLAKILAGSLRKVRKKFQE